MKTIITLIVSLFCLTSIAAEPNVVPILSIEQQIYITDNNGVLNANNIIRLKPLDNIKFYLSDGTEIIALVTKTEEINKEVFKVFGDVQNKNNSGFGFVLTKDGIFAGAVVFRDGDIVYTVEYSEEAKGHMLVKSKNKKNEKLAHNKKKSLTGTITVL